MQSAIIVGLEEKAKERVWEIAKDNNVSKFDVEILETEKALGIPDVRLLQKRVFLKPLKGDKKMIVIEAFFGATPEAQNSLLKVLEEPPISTIMIILAKTTDFLLPTILSRCTILEITKKKKLTDEDLEKNLNILKQIKQNKVGKGFLYAQNNGKSREEALVFIEDLIVSLHSTITKTNNDFSLKEIQKMLKELQKFRKIIKTTNINIRFTLENLFLNF